MNESQKKIELASTKECEKKKKNFAGENVKSTPAVITEA